MAPPALGAWLELLTMDWLATLLLIRTLPFAVDVVTAFGFVPGRWAPALRGWAFPAGSYCRLSAVVSCRASARIARDTVLQTAKRPAPWRREQTRNSR